MRSRLSVAMDLPLMPWPARITKREGELLLPERVPVNGHERVVALFAERLRRKTGIEATPSAAGTSLICFEQSGDDQTEAYNLSVDFSRAMVRAPSQLGLLRGAETLLQLVQSATRSIPAVEIDDHPRFRWRGALVDPARHFLPLDLVKRFLDCMAAVKLNVLHWHLCDDQGFRIESQRFPRLHQLASDGQYYRSNEVREVIEYAGRCGIRVVPEFDIPGHTTSWLAGYPWLGSAPGDETAGESSRYELQRKWGPSSVALDPTREEVFEFLKGFFEETCALFPDECVHIGGDEVLEVVWSSNPRIVAYMREHGMDRSHDLQVYFNQRLREILERFGKRMVGWDEILHEDLPASAIVQSWRGQSFFVEALKRHQAILSSGFYLDQLLPASYHYAVDPEESPSLTVEDRRRIAGGEACLWGEYISAENFDSRAWPRLAAVAERLWSAQSVRQVDPMYARLESISQHLEALGARHRTNPRQMLERIAGENPPAVLESLTILAEVVEPVKFYDRAIARLDSSLTPLTRLVDAVHPESETSRRFSRLVGRLLDGDQAVEREIRLHLERWRDHRSGLAAAADRNPLLCEVDVVSRNLEKAARAGLDALDQTGGPPADERWWLRRVSAIERGKSPQAELVLVVLPAIRQLVDRAAGRS